MPGYMNNDGSELVGGQLPSGAGQALQLDNSGNLKTTATLTPPSVQRVDAQSGDFAAGSIVDLATLLALAGTSGDANTVASFMGRFTKIRDLLALLTFDNTTELKVSMYGTNASPGDTAFPINASGNIKTNINSISGGVVFNTNLNQVLGAALSASNGVITESAAQNAARNAQQFIASITYGTAQITSGMAVMHILNSSTSKNIIIFSIRIWYNTAGVHPLVKVSQTTASDANVATALTPANKKGGGAASAITVTTVATANGTSGPTSLAGTVVDTIDLSANNSLQLLSNGAVYVLPANAANGLEVGINAPNGESGITIEYLEY